VCCQIIGMLLFFICTKPIAVEYKDKITLF
jgi:hypothetical protein